MAKEIRLDLTQEEAETIFEALWHKRSSLSETRLFKEEELEEYTKLIERLRPYMPK